MDTSIVSAAVSNVLAKYTSNDINITDQTSYSVTHNLGTEDIILQLYKKESNDTNKRHPVLVDYAVDSANAITLDISGAEPGTYRLVILAAK